MLWSKTERVGYKIMECFEEQIIMADRLRIIWVSGKLPTHPSPKLTLKLTSCLGQNDDLGEGCLGGFLET